MIDNVASNFYSRTRNFLSKNGLFLLCSSSLMATGFVKNIHSNELTKTNNIFTNSSNPNNTNNDIELNEIIYFLVFANMILNLSFIYKILKLKKYVYRDEFKKFISINVALLYFQNFFFYNFLDNYKKGLSILNTSVLYGVGCLGLNAFENHIYRFCFPNLDRRERQDFEILQNVSILNERRVSGNSQLERVNIIIEDRQLQSDLIISQAPQPQLLQISMSNNEFIDQPRATSILNPSNDRARSPRS